MVGKTVYLLASPAWVTRHGKKKLVQIQIADTLHLRLLAMKINLGKDEYFLDLVKEKILKVTKTGKVFNLLTGNQLATSSKQKYLMVGFRIKGTRKVVNILLHRLVYLVHGTEVLGNRLVNHKDGNKRHNNILNLEPSTHKHNNQHAFDIGLKDNLIQVLKTRVGEKNSNSCLSNALASEIRVLFSTKKYTQTALASKYNVSKMTVSRIVRNERYT
jgi:hypothetical protein